MIDTLNYWIGADCQSNYYMVDDVLDLFCEFDIGDLVRLTEDHQLFVGYGLVTDIKNSFDDVYDIDYLRMKVGTLRPSIPAK